MACRKPVAPGDLKVVINATLIPSDVAFGAQINRQGELEVPAAFKGIVQVSNGPKTASALLSKCYQSPEHVGRALGWTAEQVRDVTPSLVKALNGHVPNELLKPPKRQSPYGAHTL